MSNSNMEVNLRVLTPSNGSASLDLNSMVVINEQDRSMRLSMAENKIPFDFNSIDNDLEMSNGGGAIGNCITRRFIEEGQNSMVLNFSERYSRIDVKNLSQFTRSALLIDPVMYQLFDKVSGFATFPNLKRLIGNSLKNGSGKPANEGDSAITITMFEVLNDQVRDLLGSDRFDSKTLIAADNRDKKIEPSNLSQYYIRHPEEGISLIRKGLRSRDLSISSKSFNSHCFIYINVFTQITNTSYRKTRLSIVDLATLKPHQQQGDLKSMNELRRNLQLLKSNQISMSCIRSSKLSKLLFYDHINSNQFISLVFNVDLSTDSKSITSVLNSLNGKNDEPRGTSSYATSLNSATVRANSVAHQTINVPKRSLNVIKRLSSSTIVVAKRSDRISKPSIMPKRSVSMPGRSIMNDALSKLKLEHDQLISELDNKRQRESELEVKYSELSKNIEEHLAKINEVEIEKTTLVDKKTKYEDKISELTLNLTSLENLTDELRSSKDQYKCEIDNLTGELKSTNDKYLSLNLEFSNCKNELESKSKEINGLRGKLSAEESKIKEITTSKTDLESKLNDLQNQLTDLQIQLTNTQNQLLSSKKECSEKDTQLSHSLKDLNLLKLENNNNLGVLQRELDLFKSDLSTKSQELESSRGNTDELKQEILALTNQLSDERSKSSDLVNKNKNLEMSIKSLRLTNMKLEEELKTLKKSERATKSRESSLPPLINDTMIAPPPSSLSSRPAEVFEIFEDPTPAPSKSPSKSASKSPVKAASKSPAKAASKSPAKAASKSPAKAASKSPAKQKTKKRKVSMVSNDIIPGDPFVDSSTKENVIASSLQPISQISLPSLATSDLRYTPMKMSKNSSLNVLSSPPAKVTEDPLVKPIRSASTSPRRGKRRLRKISADNESEDDY